MKTNRYYSLAIIGIWLTLSSICAAAASNYRFTHITTNEGLPHQQITYIKQDNLGRMWIATRNGLACYDGYEITTYFNEAGNEHQQLGERSISGLQGTHLGGYRGRTVSLPAGF